MATFVHSSGRAMAALTLFLPERATADSQTAEHLVRDYMKCLSVDPQRLELVAYRPNGHSEPVLLAGSEYKGVVQIKIFIETDMAEHKKWTQLHPQPSMLPNFGNPVSRVVI